MDQKWCLRNTFIHKEKWTDFEGILNLLLSIKTIIGAMLKNSQRKLKKYVFTSRFDNCQFQLESFLKFLEITKEKKHLKMYSFSD